MENFYTLLSVPAAATPEEIKKAFRGEIARYHPDKVQHLGKEFQEMAATRAAALTEAYRTLMNPELRADYDRRHLEPQAPPPAAAPPPEPERPSEPEPADAPSGKELRFAAERRDRDDFVKRATLARFRQALEQEVGGCKDLPQSGFDLDCATRAKGLFARSAPQRFVLRLVPQIDRAAIHDAWVAAAQKRALPVSVFLMSSTLAPAGELAAAIADMRRKSRPGTRVTLIPVDVRDWTAHIPTDAQPVCRKVLERLRTATA